MPVYVGEILLGETVVGGPLAQPGDGTSADLLYPLGITVIATFPFGDSTTGTIGLTLAASNLVGIDLAASVATGINVTG